MRLFKSALCLTIAGGLLAGCGGNLSPAGNSVPSIGSASRPISVYDDFAPLRSISVLHEIVPEAKKKPPTTGIYVSEFGETELLGYAADNKANKAPICTVQGVSSVNGVAVDLKGNLIDPDGGSGYIIVYKGPGMCPKKQLGLISDTYGQPSDASTPDGATDTIAVGNIVGKGTAPGSLSLCTLKAGTCTTDLTNGVIYHAGGVAMSPGGDCWLDAKTSSTGGAALVYFKGCAGGGVVAKGFKQTYYGGIDIDNKGQLVINDLDAEDTYIYSGCNPTCKVVGGPFMLKGESFFGKHNAANTNYAAVDRTNAAVDVYSYNGKAIKYEYSFTKGLIVSGSKIVPEGIAQLPRSKE
ncbi:MAG: hypothetical protein WCB99_10755 [Candidatus Cybelea sp.]